MSKNTSTNSTAAKPKPGPNRLKIVGHRGAAGLAPENTVAAIQAGLKHHVDIIETDVHLTKDGVVVASHEPSVVVNHDGTDTEYPIAEHTLQQLRIYKPDLATLSELITAINHRVPLLIEAKKDVPTAPVIAIVKSFLAKGWLADHFIFGSFEQALLLELHRALPDVPTIVIESWSGVRAHWRARQLNTKLLCMNERWLWTGFIRPVSRRGYRLFTYTLNNPDKAQVWSKAGLSGVVTDHPEDFETRRPSK